jgi:hypothetical protein
MTDEPIRQLLSFGFVPNAELASEYLHVLFGGPAIFAAADPSTILTEIIEERTRGASHVAIPLSGGRDSRALLGAALRLFPASNVQCITFGSTGSADVEGARAVCSNAGVGHQIVDPDTLPWDLEQLTDDMHRRLVERLGTPPIDGMVVFGELARSIPRDVPVLSGYLGIAAVGKHLGGSTETGDAGTVARFLKQNSAILGERDDAIFTRFLASHERLLESWPGLTRYDLLDFGFRQRLRIRSSVTGSFSNVIRAYEDLRWIRHWFAQPLSARLNYAGYDRHLSLAFPLIFGRPPLISRIRRWRGRRAGRGAYRGDPRRNPSMAAALDEACRTFDARKLGLSESASAAFNQLMREPTLAGFRKVRWFATAELLARAEERLPSS